MKTIMTRMKHRLETASNWSNVAGLVALHAALVFTTGCASTGKVEPIAQRLPKRASSVALVSASPNNRFYIREPNTEFSAPVLKVISSSFAPARKALEAGGGRDAIPGYAIALAWVPPGVVLGGIRAVAATAPEGEVENAIQTASKFMNSYDFEAELVRKVCDMAWTDHEIGLNSFVANGSEPTYASLSQRGIRHVIEMQMGPVTLDGEYEFRNPRLALKVDVTAKLYRLHDSRREEIHLIQVHYQGDKQRFVRLMAEDAKAFRAEVDKCQRTIAAQILAAFAE